MTRLALVRHGRTAWNRERRLQGHTDNALVAEGRADARASAQLLRGECWAGIIATPLRRTQQSAAIIAAALGLAEASVDRALMERDFAGSDGLPVAEALRRWPEHGASPDAESLEAVGIRAAAAFDRLLAERPNHVVVAHGALIRAGVARLSGDPVPRIGNGGIVLLHRDAAGVRWEYRAIAATEVRS